MQGRTFFFAGGGTGGHIYPAIAVAEQILRLKADARIHFFCSGRENDEQILSKSGFGYTSLPAKGFSGHPGRLIGFCTSFLESCRLASKTINERADVVVIGVGGFVAAPVCWSAYKLKIPVMLLNVDAAPGRANKIIAYFAENIFVQFEETAGYFAKNKAAVYGFGCPLRSGFGSPQPAKIKEKLGLDENKKILLITGASSGSESINSTVCSLLNKMSAFGDDWQIVHLAGRGNLQSVSRNYADAKIGAKVLGYCDDMADLLAAAELVIGRSGAVSVAEYAAAGCPSICMPYPHHKDRHQYLNAEKLVQAGAGIIVDDLPDENDRAQWLWEELELLLKDDEKRAEMRRACGDIAVKDAAERIAEKLIQTV